MLTFDCSNAEAFYDVWSVVEDFGWFITLESDGFYSVTWTDYVFLNVTSIVYTFD